MRILNWIYRASLLLYLGDFRSEFGVEMAEVFSRQVEGADGLSETLAVCWYAVQDILTLALPMRLSDPRVVAPVVSVFGATAVMLPLLWALNHPRALNMLARSAFGHSH